MRWSHDPVSPSPLSLRFRVPGSRFRVPGCVWLRWEDSNLHVPLNRQLRYPYATSQQCAASQEPETGTVNPELFLWGRRQESNLRFLFTGEAGDRHTAAKSVNPKPGTRNSEPVVGAEGRIRTRVSSMARSHSAPELHPHCCFLGLQNFLTTTLLRATRVARLSLTFTQHCCCGAPENKKPSGARTPEGSGLPQLSPCPSRVRSSSTGYRSDSLRDSTVYRRRPDS